MPIEQELRKLLTDAMRARDQRTVDAVRMVTSKIEERKNAPDWKGPADDAFYVEVIAAYRKSLAKAREEFVAAGERGQAQAESLGWEVEFLGRFLPTGLSDDELRAAVRAAIAAVGAKDPKMAGRVVGEVMKQHKGRVEAGAAKRVAEEELAKG